MKEKIEKAKSKDWRKGDFYLSVWDWFLLDDILEDIIRMNNMNLNSLLHFYMFVSEFNTNIFIIYSNLTIIKNKKYIKNSIKYFLNKFYNLLIITIIILYLGFSKTLIFFSFLLIIFNIFVIYNNFFKKLR